MGQEASPRRRNGACRKEGQGIWVGRVVWRDCPSCPHLPEAGDCKVTLRVMLAGPLITAKHERAGGGRGRLGGFITPAAGSTSVPSQAPSDLDRHGARSREASSYLGPHVFLNGLTPQPRVSGLERTLMLI